MLTRPFETETIKIGLETTRDFNLHVVFVLLELLFVEC